MKLISHCVASVVGGSARDNAQQTPLFLASVSPRWPRRVVALFLSALLAFTAVPMGTAFACGGCFSPPGPNLVVQDAERILFYRDPVTNKTTVHIEVRYSGPAKDFGWVLPLPKQPKVGVGNSYIFDRLDQAVAPRFYTKFSSTRENCHFSNASSAGFGCSTAMSDSAQNERGAGSTAFGGREGGEEKVQVLEKAQAGPYDYEVLSSTDSKALLKWLNDNGYSTPDKALPVIESHLKKGDIFVAFKLTNGAGVDEVRPVTLEMDGADACVPLRLTAIAASDNMAVVVYLLGKGRGVPKNHLHVKVNEAKLRWAGGVNNYNQVLAAAIDEAAGRAFVTEFAGKGADVKVELPDAGFRIDSTALFSNTIPNPNQTRDRTQASLTNSIWRAGELFDKKFLVAAKFQDAVSAEDVVKTLQDSQLLVIPETAALLENATKLAELHGSTDVVDFWTKVRANTVKLKFDKTLKPVDGAKLFQDIKVGIIEPIYIVNDALQAKDIQLTRLHMRISPDEMDRDPIFAFHTGLPPVTMNHTAEMRMVCTRGGFTEDAVRLTLSSGSWIFPNTRVDFSANQQAQVSSSMTTNLTQDARFKDAPFASDIELLEESGAPIPVPLAQINLVDTAIAGAEVGKKSLPASLVLSGALSTWQPPKSDPDAGLATAAEQAHVDDSGCAQALGLRSRSAGMWLVLAAMMLLVLVRRRRLS